MAKPPSRDESVDTRQFRESLRLRFEYDGETLRLIEQQRIRNVALASPGRRPQVGEQRGFWVELQTARGKTLFHRPVRNPLRTHVEVHSHDEGPQLLTGPPQPGTFTVIVPAIPDATQVVVCGTPLDEERARERDGRAEELARFDLRTEGGAA